jgi:protein O-GlcNAc transferase
LSNISILRPAWARGRRSITIFLGFCLLVALLLLQEPLLSDWYGNRGYLDLSRALLLGGDEGLLKARASFVEAQAWQRDNPSAAWGLGQAYYHLGDEDAATLTWQKSERSLPLLLSSSDAAFNRQDYPLALDLALLAQRLDPHSSSVAYRLGEAYRATGELERALEEYERAKEYNAFLPGDEADLASCYFGQARVYEARRNWEAAIWHYEAGLEMRPDAGACVSLGEIYQYHLKDLETAESLLKQAIALEPDQAWWHVSLGELYLAQQKYEEAAPEFQRALALDPENKEAQQGLERAVGTNTGDR